MNRSLGSPYRQAKRQVPEEGTMATQTSTSQDQGQYVRANGIDIHYVDQGRGQPLLVLNNAMVSTRPVWNGSPAAYGEHLNTLAEEFRVIAPDTRGSGRSKHSGGPISYELLADDVLALIDALGLERPLICGFSDGGQVASIIGIRSPGSVRAIVNHAGYDLFNPNAPSISIARHTFGGSADAQEPDAETVAGLRTHPQMGQLFELMEKDHDSAQGPGHWKAIVAWTFQRITQSCGYTFDDLARTMAPTLILVGDRDFLCSVEEAAVAYRALPDGELGVLPNTGHMITLSAVQQTIEFFKRRIGLGA